MGFETINHSLRVTKLLNITLYIIGRSSKFRMKKHWQHLCSAIWRTTHELPNQQNNEIQIPPLIFRHSISSYILLSFAMEISFYAVSFGTCETKKKAPKSNQPINHRHHIHGSCTHDCVTSLAFLPSRGATNEHNSGNDHRSIVSLNKPLFCPLRQLLG